jgi:hypothetical protein
MVKDMDKAIGFYEQIGLTIKQRWENHYAMLTTEGITIGLHPTDSDETSSGTISIGFMIEHIAEAKALLEANNIPYKDEEGSSGHYLHFRDPDNTIVYFVEPRWRKP